MNQDAIKNIMIIDGAINCAYDIFCLPKHEFDLLFPRPGQDIQFIEDLEFNSALQIILKNLWENPVNKKNVKGIDGTLFFGMQEKKKFYPNKRDSDLDFKGRAFSVNEMLNR